jgi:hypothetical protein
LFSQGKLIATDHRACLGIELFEKVQLMKYTWRKNLEDWAATNSSEIEDVLIEEFQQLLGFDEIAEEWAVADN